MVYESIVNENKGRMGYLLIGHEGERYSCFSKNLVIDPIKDGKMLKFGWNNLFFALETGAFCY